MKKKIEAKIVADSVDNRGNRIITYLLTYPRMIHGELMTHRLFSRNSASSRAIPFKTMVKSIMDDPFIPIAWQKDHKGMQGVEYFTTSDIDVCERIWRKAAQGACASAILMNSNIITKQLCNRLLEPYAWHTVLVTATEYDNFFDLRLPQYKLIGIGGEPAKSRKEWLDKMKYSSGLHLSDYPKTEEDWWKLSESGAEIHIQALAESMWDAKNESTPVELKEGEWHVPFGDKINNSRIWKILGDQFGNRIPEPGQTTDNPVSQIEYSLAFWGTKIKIATARAARLSYMTFDGEINYQKDIELHNILLESKHFSPFEHCAKVMTNEEYHDFINGRTDIETSNGFTITTEDQRGWCNNFKGFIQYRYLLENKYVLS